MKAKYACPAANSRWRAVVAAGMVLVSGIHLVAADPPPSIPWQELEQVDADGGLLPAYANVMRRPLEYFGISIWSGPEEGGGYMAALTEPSVIDAGGLNVFKETEIVETLDDYRQLVELGVNFVPFTHTLFTPADNPRGFYTYDKVKEVIGVLERQRVPVSAYFGLANHPGFPLFSLKYAKEDRTRFQRNAAGQEIVSVLPVRRVINPALSWEHPDLAMGAVNSAAYHAAQWRGFSNVPFWCLMGENLFAKGGDYSDVHRKHFAAWLKRRYGSPARLADAWQLDTPVDFAKVEIPKVVDRSSPTTSALDLARFRRDSLSELYRAVRAAVRGADPDRMALGLFHSSADTPAEFVGMGIHPDRIAAATDGIASSHVLWPSTRDPCNLVNLAVFRSFGKPVVVPILGLEQEQVINDFTSSNYRIERIARRTYEHLGMGVWALAVGYWKSWGWTLAHHERGKQEVARLAAELKRLDPDLHGMQPVPRPVGLVISADDAALSGIPAECLAIFAEATKRGLPVEFVYEERLLSNRPPVPPVLVVAADKSLSESGAERITEHIRQGHSVLVWATGDHGFFPKAAGSRRNVRVLEPSVQPDMRELVGWLTEQASPSSLPVQCDDNGSGLETFALCDGVNVLIVAINTLDSPLREAAFTINDRITNRALKWQPRVGESVRVAGRQVTVSLKPQEVAVLLGEPEVPESWRLDEELSAMQRRLDAAAAERFDVVDSRRLLSESRTHWAAGRRSKALAGLLRLRRLLLVTLEIQAQENAAQARTRVVSLGKALPETTRAVLRFPDHGDLTMPLRKASDGTWEATLLRDDRIAVYDYRNAQYVPRGSPIAVQAEILAETYAGASPVVSWSE